MVLLKKVSIRLIKNKHPVNDDGSGLLNQETAKIFEKNPLYFAKMLLGKLNLSCEENDYIAFASALIRDIFDNADDEGSRPRYACLRLERSRRDPEKYAKFYNAVTRFAPDFPFLPLPKKGNVVTLSKDSKRPKILRSE